MQRIRGLGKLKLNIVVEALGQVKWMKVAVTRVWEALFVILRVCFLISVCKP